MLIEPLEPRCLMSASAHPEKPMPASSMMAIPVHLKGTLLVITGVRSAANVIVVRLTANKMDFEIDTQVQSPKSTRSTVFYAVNVVTRLKIYGGSGSDYIRIDETAGAIGIPALIRGGGGADTLIGGSGDDRIVGGRGGGVIIGGSGKNTLIAVAGKNTIAGGKDRDIIVAGTGDDSIDGGAGGDAIFLGHGHTTVAYHKGDHLRGGGGNQDITTVVTPIQIPVLPSWAAG